MSYNGSGTFTVLSSFTSGTTISSSAMNALLADIASGLSNAVCKDGQSSITGQIAVAAGTVSLPGLTFSGDTNCGMYRIGADNIGFAAAGAKVLDISSTGLAVTGTLSSTAGISGTTGTFTNVVNAGDGTVSAPGIAFGSDADTGLYRIGANNIGVAANGAKVVDVGTSGVAVTGTLSATSTISKSGVAVECFAAATQMIFVQTSAPTGWTKVTTTNNAALRLVSGSASTGGTADFTSVFASRTIGQTNLPSYQLSHTLALVSTVISNGTTVFRGSLGSTNAAAGGTAVLTASGVTAETLSLQSGTVSGAIELGGSGTGMDFAVKYVDVIRAQKD